MFLLSFVCADSSTPVKLRGMPLFIKRRAVFLSLAAHLLLIFACAFIVRKMKPVRTSALSEVSLSAVPGQPEVKKVGDPHAEKPKLADAGLLKVDVALLIADSSQPAERGKEQFENSKGSAHSEAVALTTAHAEKNYVSDLQRAILAHQHYPLEARKRGLSGVVEVSFELSESGELLKITESKLDAANPILEKAARAAIQEAAPFPPPPPGMARQFRIPVEFTIVH